MKKRHHKRIWVVNQFELGLGDGGRISRLLIQRLTVIHTRTSISRCGPVWALGLLRTLAEFRANH